MNELARSLRFDPIVTESLFGDSRHKGGMTAERELMLAILADAIDCFWKYCDARDFRSARLFRDANQWLFSDDEEQTFSFLNLCEALGLDAAYVRRGIRSGVEARRRARQENVPPRQSRLRKIKRNFKSTTRWKVRSRPFKT